MAFLVKNSPQTMAVGQADAAAPRTQQVILSQIIHVFRPALALPQATTEQLFRVFGGLVLIRGLRCEVTTVIQALDPVLSVLSKALDKAAAVIGTAVTVASTVSMASLEVGGSLWVPGDGTALVSANAGQTLIGVNRGLWIAPQGEIYASTTASRTGAVKWDLWYQPLTEGAVVVSIPTAIAAI